jgi:hypothetical protein
MYQGEVTLTRLIELADGHPADRVVIDFWADYADDVGFEVQFLEAPDGQE